MLLEAVASQQDDCDGSGGDDSGNCDQLTLNSLVKPVDWPDSRCQPNWRFVTITLAGEADPGFAPHAPGRDG